MGRITPRAAEKLRQTVQKVANLPPQGAGFADPGLPIRLGKTTVAHAEDETEEVKLWWGEKGEESEGATERDKVQVYNRTGEIPADTFVYIAKINGSWEVIRGGVPPQLVVIQSTVGPGEAGTGRVYEITNTPPITSGTTITIAAVSPTRDITVLNFRPNYLAAGVAYLAHQMSGFWVIENDACFQDFMS